MNATPKKKLCWNCEGRVDLKEENCPYCAVYLGPAIESEEDAKDDILAPPYKIVEFEEEETENATHPSPYAVEEEDAPVKHQQHEAVSSSGDMKKIAIPLAFLSGGFIFFLFGVVLFIFSNEGAFTLQWNGTYWYYYLLFAVPMLFFGWRALQHLEDEEEEGYTN